MKKCVFKTDLINDDKPGIAPGFLMWKLTHLWQRFMKSKLEKLELTHIQFALLKLLLNKSSSDDRKELITQSEIAHLTDMNVMMVSQVLRNLEKRNIIRRIPHPSDTRAKVVELTTEGEKLINEAFKIVQKANDEFFKPFEKDMPKITLFIKKILEKNKDLV